MSNVLILKERGANLLQKLSTHGVKSGHFTNGVYAAPTNLIVPTVLAGFQNALDQDNQDNTPIIVAVNSNDSMSILMRKKGATRKDEDGIEDEVTRAVKIANPLTYQFPNRKIVVVFYDEETPNTIFKSLQESGFGMRSLFKWGYEDSVVEGAEFFEKARVHSLPNNQKPFAHDITRATGQEGTVELSDLRVREGKHGMPYISSDNRVLFRVTNAALRVYTKAQHKLVA